MQPEKWLIVSLCALAGLSCDEEPRGGVATDELGRPVVSIPERTTYDYSRRRDRQYPFSIDVLRGWATAAVPDDPALIFLLAPSGPTKQHHVGGLVKIVATGGRHDPGGLEESVALDMLHSAYRVGLQRTLRDLTLAEAKDTTVAGGPAKAGTFQYAERGRLIKARYVFLRHQSHAMAVALHGEQGAFEKAEPDFDAMIASIRWTEIPEASTQPGE
jgi:hypothetical protein